MHLFVTGGIHDALYWARQAAGLDIIVAGVTGRAFLRFITDPRHDNDLVTANDVTS